MAVNLENFNRIIDIEFSTSVNTRQKTTNGKYYDSTGRELRNYTRSIICPRHGIKPQIELNASYGDSKVLEVFNITIKNLYMDLRSEPYSKIKVRAGYANNWVQFDANIFSMFQESPGPEGTTVIQCKTGDLTKSWLDSFIAVNYDKGQKLTEILQNIKSKVSGSDVALGAKAKTLALEDPLQYNGDVRGLLSQLEERFAERNLRIFPRGSKICAICVTDGDFINTRVLQYMSAPPQQNPGDENGNWHTMITAPWMPDLLPGDLLIIPSNVYINSGSLVGGAKKTQKLQITNMHFNFGTRGTVNQMTCDGFIVR